MPLVLAAALALLLLARGADAARPPLLAADGDPAGNSSSDTGDIATCVSKPATTLSAGIDNVVTTIPVASTSGFPPTGTINIDSELITYTGTTATSFTGGTRGALGTAAASHLINAFVGPRFQVDFVFQGIPPTFGPEFDLTYSGTVLRIDSQDISTTTSLFLTKRGSTGINSFTDPGNDIDGTFHVAVFDFDFTGPSGDGAVVRLNVSARAVGTSALTIASPLMLDVVGNDVTAQFAFANSEVRVGSACPAAGHFQTGYSNALNTAAAGGLGNSLSQLGVPGPGALGAEVGPSYAHISPSTVSFSPPDTAVTPGTAIPIGRVVGSVSNSLFLSVLNSDCFNPVVASFTLRNADTDIRDAIAPRPDGTFNRMGTLRLDLRGATAGSAANGIADYLDAYPSFLNTIFDPEDSDVSGKSPVYPLRPLARYAGDTNVSSTDVILEYLVFGRGALTQFSAAGASQPFQQFTDDFGYAAVMVLQDPTAYAPTSTITDICAPFRLSTALSAAVDPEVPLVTNQCDDATDDDDNYPVTAAQQIDGLINDGCPRIGVAESGGQCGNIIDDAEDTPADGAVNDGCPANTVGTAEIDCAIGEALPLDDDTDGIVNDGCGIVGAGPEIGEQCANSTDDDADGGAINDGCPVALVSVAENAGLVTLQCSGGADDDADGTANDGCPQFGAPETACTGDSTTTLTAGITGTDTTITVASTTGFPASGTIQILSEIISYTATTATTFTGATRGALGTTAAAHATADQVSEAIDDDLDGDINDGCATVSASVGAGFTATRASNPPSGTGLLKTNTHLNLSFNMSQRDADSDGLENGVDACPLTADNDGDGSAEGPGNPDTTPWDPRAAVHATGQDDDGDKIPAGCDLNNAVGGTDVDGDGVLNTQDNCPQFANADQLESETLVPLATSAPDGGPQTDGIGDACESNDTVADGHYHATLHKAAVCVTPGVDTDSDGWCDATETTLGSVNGTSAAAGESGAQCSNNEDDDWDNLPNDGCATVGATAESGAQCLNSTDDEDNDGGVLGIQLDGAVNDGCPGVSTPENVAVNYTLSISSSGATAIAPATAGVAQTCNDGVDNDGDTLVDAADAGCTAAGIDPDADGVCDSSPAAANCVLVTGNGASPDGVDNCVGLKNPNQQNTDFVLNASGATVDPDGAAGSTAPTALPTDTLGDACDADDDNDSFTGGVTVTTGGATTGVCRSTVSVNIFRDCIENYLGTDQFDNCPASTTANNEAVDSWPVDLNDSSVIDGLDTSAFTTAQTGQNVRADFNGDLSVNLFDLSLLRNLGATGTAFFTKDCSPP